MIAPGVRFEDIDQGHLRALIENGVAERRTIEYKRELPGGNDESKREFLADVSSFANANGGDLVYGITEDDGVPVAIAPLDITPDAERLRWEQVIRGGIDPRTPGLRVREIEVDGGYVLLFRIPRSWTGPHAVTFRGSFRFFSRTSAGKYPLDVGELRSAFLAGTALGEQIKNFRADRLGPIMAGDEPIPLPPHGKIVVHLIPLEAFTSQQPLELGAVEGSGLFTPIFRPGRGVHTRWNIDGYLTYDTDRDERQVIAYSQLFRNGIFEGVDATTIQPRDDPNWGGPMVYANWIEAHLNSGMANPLAVLDMIGVQPPLVVTVSIVGARNYLVISNDPLRETSGGGRHLIDREVLMLPDVLVEEYPAAADIPRLMRPIVDAWWQAGGWWGSPDYDADGNWQRPR